MPRIPVANSDISDTILEEKLNTYLGDEFPLKANNNIMNNVNATDVTLFSLALADFSAATTYLVAHDYPVAGGLFVIGLVLAYLYHKLGS